MKAFRYLRRRFPSLFEFVMIFVRQGPRGYIDYVRNSRLGWSAKSLFQNYNEPNASSISDGTSYVQLCKLAVQEDYVFAKFKSSFEYRGILEHCDYSQGLKYLRMIEKNSEVMSRLKEISKVENGQPFTFFYKGLGKVSPTQIRYAKVTQDLESLFGSLDNFDIAEIGAGYGGQAIHILNRWSPSQYFIYDLEWPSKLAIKNVKQSPIDLYVQPEIKSWEEQADVDLVISNYAFSELFRDVQETYFRSIIASSKAGYVIYNHIHERDNLSMSAEEFASRISGAVILKEKPLSFPGNVLVVWGHNPKADLKHFL